ncbi:nucleotidyltransferase family protein [Elongatibacter sediminis]|uniref:Nucleotidyltransferase family protein n=1 Tax=Elongatibacter sediminis TaxID=3119006 RepID=A0AAW9REB6_9GAMM
MSYAAVVLAGERPGGSDFARALGLPAGVLATVAGKPALQRVIEALAEVDEITGGVVCGPGAEVWSARPDLARRASDAGFEWMPPEAGPSASALAGVRRVDSWPVLVTAGDHALLTPSIVEDFCRQALRRATVAGADVVAGLAPFAAVREAFPDTRRTVHNYRDGAWCGTNLFAVLTPQGLGALRFWQSVEAWRKRPWKIAAALGTGFLLRYLLRRLTLDEALQRLSTVCGCRVAHVVVSQPRAAVDVDSLADLELAEEVLRGSA